MIVCSLQFCTQTCGPGIPSHADEVPVDVEVSMEVTVSVDVAVLSEAGRVVVPVVEVSLTVSLAI